MKYTHKKTGWEVELKMDGTTAQYVGAGSILHPAIVENSDEWELIDDDNQYNIEQMRKAFIAINDKWSILPSFVEQFIEALKRN